MKGLYLIMALVAILVAGISWITTCGIFYLITLCFSLEFSWLTATGIWLILLLVGGTVKSNVTVKK